MTIQVINAIPKVLYQTDFFDKPNQKRNIIYLELNLSTFEQQCQMLNDLLMEKKLFLSMCKLRKTFCYLIKKNTPKKSGTKDFFACVEKKCNSFEIVRKLIQGGRQIFKPLNIIYKPVRKF